MTRVDLQHSHKCICGTKAARALISPVSHHRRPNSLIKAYSINDEDDEGALKLLFALHAWGIDTHQIAIIISI